MTTTLTGSLLDQTLDALRPVDPDWLAAAQSHQLRLIKPAGALGRLEEVGNRLCAIAETVPPPVPSRPIAAVFAGDHGIQRHRISPWQQEVSVQILTACCAGRASINAIATAQGVEVWPVDVGVAVDPGPLPGLRSRVVRRGTADITTGPAMSRQEALAAVEVGIEVAQEAVLAGADLMICGEIGIGNTAIAAALIATLAGVDAQLVTGRGAGAGDQILARKVATIRAALDLHRPDPGDPIGVLAAVGGLEHAAMAGWMLAGAAAGLPVLVDGVICCSSAMLAVRLSPALAGHLFASHAGAEPGIRVALDDLGLEPLLDLGMRLGEGGGSAMAYPVLRAAAQVMNQMGTFTGAGVNADHDAR